MKVLIEMPREHYDLFAAELDIKSPAYTVLKNGIVPKSQKAAGGARTIEILCEKEEADLLLDAAHRHYPAAAPSIAEAIAGAREA
jgi:hypothetical protein